MRARTLVIGIVGVGMAAVCVGAYRANARRLRALESEMRAMVEENRQNRGAEGPRGPLVVLPVPVAQPASATEAHTAIDTDGKDETATTKPKREITDAEIAAHVNVTFKRQPVDQGWARDAERSIGGSLRGIAESATLEGIECRQTLCEARLRHSDQANLGKFVDRIAAHANEIWTGEIYSQTDSSPDGAVRNTIFFARQGESIPFPE